MFAQSNIQIQMLLIYSMGLGIFKHIVTIQEARIRLLTLINKLKAGCLLLDGDKDGFVKMHDVVRDTAISIAIRLQHAFIGAGQIGSSYWPSQNCTKISLPYCHVRELPADLECPQADLFLLFTEDLCLEIPDSFFQGLRTLKVVGFSGVHSLSSLPSSLGLLLNLHRLSLQRCRLNSVDVIGQLKQLQFLSLSGSKIAELPREIEELTLLKLLDLSNCTMLRVIPANVFSKFLLDELYMLNSFDRWDTKGNASLVELEHLSQLSALEIQIINPKLIPRGFRFFDGLQLDSFKISIGEELSCDGKYENSKKLNLKLESSTRLGWQIEGLLRRAEDLSLHIQNDSGDIQHLSMFQMFQMKSPGRGHSFLVLNNLVDLKLEWCNNCVKLPCLGNLPHLKYLEMSHIGKVKRIDNEFYGFNDERSSNGGFNIFPALQSLSLTQMDNLTEWSSPSDGKTVMLFPRLQNLYIQSCPKLTGFPTRDISGFKKLVVKDCEELMLVILEKQSFAYLGGLSFKGCSKLTNLLNWLIPPAKSFKELIVSRCEWLTILPYDLQKVSNLTSLEIYCCRRLRCFPEDILFKLTKLQHLSVGAFSEELDDDFCYLNRIKDLRRLKELEIWGSDFLGREMRCLPDQLQHLSALRSLKVMGFTAMEELPEWLTNLQYLGSLSLDYCRNLKGKSTAAIIQRLLNLTHLNIRCCPILQESESEWLQPLHSRKIQVELSHVSEVRVRLGY